MLPYRGSSNRHSNPTSFETSSNLKIEAMRLEAVLQADCPTFGPTKQPAVAVVDDNMTCRSNNGNYKPLNMRNVINLACGHNDSLAWTTNEVCL
jgi:hypothetical protein